MIDIFPIAVVLWTECFSFWVLNITHNRVAPFTWLDCKLFYFLTPFSAELSSNLLAVMCIEKFFALYFPLRTRSLCTIAMAKRVTFSVTLILAGYNIQAFFFMSNYVLPNSNKSCSWINVSFYSSKIHFKIESTLYSFAPFTIMVLTNGAIIYKFMRASCARDQGGTESTNQALSKSANKGTTMLATVSLAFLILTGPASFVNLNIKHIDPILLMVFVLLRYTNNSINAVLYCVSGSRFRNELKKTFPFHLCSGSQGLSNLVLQSTTMSEINVRPAIG